MILPSPFVHTLTGLISSLDTLLMITSQAKQMEEIVTKLSEPVVDKETAITTPDSMSHSQSKSDSPHLTAAQHYQSFQSNKKKSISTAPHVSETLNRELNQSQIHNPLSIDTRFVSFRSCFPFRLL